MLNLVNTDSIAGYPESRAGRPEPWGRQLRQWLLVAALAALAVVVAAALITEWEAITQWFAPAAPVVEVQPARYTVSPEGQALRSADGVEWQALPGQTLSRATAILAQGEVLYLGTESAGLFRSDDGGQTWVALTDQMGLPMPTASVTALAAAEDGAVYAAIGYWLGTSEARLTPWGVYVTSDGGASWTQWVGPAANAPIVALQPDDADPGLVLAQVEGSDAPLAYRAP